MAGSKEDISTEVPVYYKSLSLMLCKVLEDIGASTAVRDASIKTMTTIEILKSFYLTLLSEQAPSTSLIVPKWSLYVFGSSFEGAKTIGLASDLDEIYVPEHAPVVVDISDAQQYARCLLMIQDSYTPPGYVKMQHVIHGLPKFLSVSSYQSAPHTPLYSDKECRSVFIFPRETTHPDGVLHGPAETVEATEMSEAKDIVPALRCGKVLDCGSEWFSRQRQYNWPTVDWIDTCKTFGCFFVRVGHPYSEENHLQFRISFSLQERLLVTRFNSVQLKCYILLKIIKKEIIRNAVGVESLTSYHCKTCMLYMIENTPAEFWREDNLMRCLYACLNMILMWVETGVCPNYFIPEENMFDGRIFGAIQIKLRMVLRNILSADFRMLLELKTDEIGKRFQEAIVLGVHVSRYMLYKEDFIAAIRLKQIHYLLVLRNLILLDYQKEHVTMSVTCKGINGLKFRLQNTDVISEHTHEQTHAVLSLLSHYIEISLMSILTISAVHLHKSNKYIFKILTSEKWHKISLESDSFSSKLKQASLLYMVGFCDVSLDILLSLERRHRRQVSFCCCSDRCRNWLEAFPAIKEVSADERLNQYIIPCVVYLTAEKDLTPTALCYEMSRSAGSPPDGREEWFDWAIVDGKILLYFLLYLNHRHFGMEAYAVADVENIKWLIETDKCLGHRETALNLLGWIYKDRNLLDNAVECFQKSLSLQPIHNAAMWQLACVICARINNTVAFSSNRCS